MPAPLTRSSSTLTAAAAFRFQTLVALVLSARTTDAAVAHAMARLRALAAPLDPEGRLTAQALAEVASIDLELLRKALHGVSYSRVKAERVAQIASTLSERHGGDAPTELAEVLALPGVGPKVR